MRRATPRPHLSRPSPFLLPQPSPIPLWYASRAPPFHISLLAATLLPLLPCLPTRQENVRSHPSRRRFIAPPRSLPPLPPHRYRLAQQTKKPANCPIQPLTASKSHATDRGSEQNSLFPFLRQLQHAFCKTGTQYAASGRVDDCPVNRASKMPHLGLFWANIPAFIFAEHFWTLFSDGQRIDSRVKRPML